MASQESIVSPPDPKMTSQSQQQHQHLQEPKIPSHDQEPPTTTAAALSPPPLLSIYSNRVELKTIFKLSDRLIGEKIVIGGWVKSSKEVVKEPPSPPQQQQQPADIDHDAEGTSPGPKDVSCVEILQSRIPLFRSLVKILAGGCGGGSRASLPAPHKVEPPAIPRSPLPLPPPPSTVYLLVNDGSCVPNLQVVVESSIASPSELLPTGTCILAEGVLKESSVPDKQITIELQAERMLHIGTVGVDPDSYPLSKKKVPLDSLRDASHFRPRTTTVASVMRIRSALTFATHAFFRDHGFLNVQVPIITTTDAYGFSEKFQVTTLIGREEKVEEQKGSRDNEGVSLETIKAAVKEKSNLVEQLKRSESNREALDAALEDLRKTNQLAEQVEAKEKMMQKKSAVTSMSMSRMKSDKLIINFSEDFFSQQTYLTVSGLLHLESYACALGNVYSYGPRFRAERRASAKHAAEMWMVEVQMAFSGLEDAMNCANDLFTFLCKYVVENCLEDMKFVCKRIDKTSIERLHSMISSSPSYQTISYMDAVDILKKVTEKEFETKLEWGIPLTAEHLSFLADEKYKRPVMVYNYPKEVKPFYARLNDDGKTVAAFDMVVPKVGTIITGAQSEERFDMLETRIKELGLGREEYEWYLDLRRHGTVKHSGFSLVLDLMVLLTTGLPDVRDAIPFPRSYRKANN